MVREQPQGTALNSDRENLHLLSCISPDWVRDGKEIVVRRAPTLFGQVNFTMRFMKGSAALKLDNRFTSDPAHLVLHLPWFMSVKSVRAEGRELTVRGSAVDLPVNAKTVEIEWSWKSGRPDLSYKDAVRNYEKEYRAKWEEFLRTGK